MCLKCLWSESYLTMSNKISWDFYLHFFILKMLWVFAMEKWRVGVLIFFYVELFVHGVVQLDWDSIVAYSLFTHGSFRVKSTNIMKVENPTISEKYKKIPCVQKSTLRQNSKYYEFIMLGFWEKNYFAKGGRCNFEVLKMRMWRFAMFNC